MPDDPALLRDALRIGAAWRLLGTNDPTLSAAILREIEVPEHPSADEALRTVLRYPVARHRLRGDPQTPAPVLSPDGRYLACVSGGRVVVRSLADGVDMIVRSRWFGCTSMAFRPDSGAIALGYDSGRMVLADIEPGEVSLREAPEFDKHEGPVVRIAWSADARTIWTGAFDFHLCSWDVETHESLSRVDLEFGITEMIDLQARAALVRPFHHGRWRIVRLDTGRATTLPEATEEATCYALRPDGREVALGTPDGQIWLFRLDNPHLATVRQAGDEEISDLAWSPDSQRLAACCGDRTLRIFANQGEMEEVAGHGPIRVFAWMTDGKGVVTGDSDGTVRVQYFSQNQPYRVIRASNREVQWVGATTDGQFFAWRCEDGVVGAIHARPDPEPRRLSFSSQGVTALAWAPAGDKLYVCLDDGGIVEAIVEPTQLRGRTVVTREDLARRARVLEDGRLAIIDEQGFVLVDPHTAAVIPHPTASTLAMAGPVQDRMVVSTTRGLLLFPLGGGASETHIAGHPAWEDLDTDFRVPRRRIEAITLDPDGEHMTLAIFATEVERWRIKPAERVSVWQAPDLVWDLATSPDGRLLALGCGHRLVIRTSDLQGDPLHIIEQNDAVMNVRFSHDGALVFTTCEDGTIAWWSVHDGRLVGRLEGHTAHARLAPHPRLPLLAIGDERSVMAVVRYDTREIYQRVRACTSLVPSEAERKRYLFGLVPPC